MVEVPWPAEPVSAELYWPLGSPEGYLHFVGPDDGRAVVPVTRGPHTQTSQRGPVWHLELADDSDEAVVSPSIHYVGFWHSPNPVRFTVTRRDVEGDPGG
jgi:hypothetical protein